MLTPPRPRSPWLPAVLVLALGVAGCAEITPTPEVSDDAAATPRPETSVPATSATSEPADEPEATPSAGVYLALGDSITFGIGVPRPREEGYVAQVADALATIDETRVFAVPGETATGFLERRVDDVARAIEAAGPRVELVTIGLGANELLRTRRDPACVEDRQGAACARAVEAALDDAGAALDRIVASVQEDLAAAGADPRILLLAYYGPVADPVAGATIAGPDGMVGCDRGPDAGLDDRIACVAEDRGVELVDLHAAFLGRELELTRFADGDVHPNASGYAVIADSILEVLSDGG